MEIEKKTRTETEIGVVDGRPWVVGSPPRRRRRIPRRQPTSGRLERMHTAHQTHPGVRIPRGDRRWFLKTAALTTFALVAAQAGGLLGKNQPETSTSPAKVPLEPIRVKLPAPTFNAEVLSAEEIQAQVDKFMAQFDQPVEIKQPAGAEQPVTKINPADINFGPSKSPSIKMITSENPISFSPDNSLASQIKFVRRQPPILIPSRPSQGPEVTVAVTTEAQRHRASFYTALAEANVNGIQDAATWIAKYDPLSVFQIQRELEKAVTILAPTDTTGLVTSLALAHNSFPGTNPAKAEALWINAQKHQRTNFDRLTRQQQMLKITIEAAKAGQFQRLSDPNVVAAPQGTIVIPENPTATSNSGSGGAGWLPGFPPFVVSFREATNTLVALAQSQIEVQPFDSYDAAYLVIKTDSLDRLVPDGIKNAMYDSDLLKPVIKLLSKLDFVEIKQFEGSMKNMGPIWQINRGGRFQVGQTFKIRSIAEMVKNLLN